MTMSDSCSLRSAGSSSSSRYRTVARGSTIDESLFGEKRRRQSPRNPNKKDVPCLSKNEYTNIANRSFIVKDEEASPDLLASKQKEQKAKERKERMIAIDQKRLQKTKSSEKEASLKKKDARVEMKLDNEQSEDIVKILNSCKHRAAAFAIRDQQLEDKSNKENEEREYERLMELSMEMKRLKDIEKREKEEEAMIKKRIADRKVIENQIQERKHQRLLQEEARDQENRKMLETIERYQKEHTEELKKRKENARKAQKEIIKRNKEILAEREAKKTFEKEEEEMILAYQSKRDEALKKREEEEREIQRKKVELQKKMLESQTKSMDKRAEIDELRGRRAAEETERKYRQRELEEARKRKRDIDLLHESRKRQEEERKMAKEKELHDKQEEYYSALAQAAEMAKREKDEAEVTEKKNASLRNILKQQIMENELKHRAEEQEKFKEGKEMKAKMDAELIKLETFREKMVSDMKSKGINDKYFGEMMTIDIKKLLMK